MIEQHKTLSEKFLKKGFWLYLFSFIIAPIGYIIKIIISGELSVSEVGILYGIISLVTLLSAYNDLGMTESLKHFIPQFVTEKRYDKVKSILAYALFSQLITSFFIAGFFFFGADFISNNYFHSEEAKNTLKIFSLFFIGINIFITLKTFFLAIQDTFYTKILDLVRMLFILISVLLIFLLDLSSLSNFSYSWLIGLYGGVIISIIIFYLKYYKKYLKSEFIILDKKLIKDIFKYALYVFLGASAGTILSQIDMQMIIYLLGTTDAGYYTNYLSIITIPFIILGPILSLLFPIFSEMHSKGEHDKIKLVKKIFTKNFLVIAIAFNILFFVFAEIIAYILFGEKFLKSGEILQYSILLLIFNFLLQINFNILAGIGKVKERVKIILVAILFNFIMNIIFIKYLGVYGAALATSFGWILIYTLSEFTLGNKYFVGFDYKFIGKNILIMGILGLLAHIYIIQIFQGLDRGISLLYMFILSLIWFGILISINFNEFKNFILEIKKLRRG